MAATLMKRRLSHLAKPSNGPIGKKGILFGRWSRWWGDGAALHQVLGVVFVPQGDDLFGCLADVGAVVDLAGEGVGDVERCNNALVHAHADTQVVLCVNGKVTQET